MFHFISVRRGNQLTFTIRVLVGNLTNNFCYCTWFTSIELNISRPDLSSYFERFRHSRNRIELEMCMNSHTRGSIQLHIKRDELDYLMWWPQNLLKQTIKLWNLHGKWNYTSQVEFRSLSAVGKLNQNFFVTRLEIITISAEKWMWCRWTSFSKWRILTRDAGENLHGSPRKL